VPTAASEKRSERDLRINCAPDKRSNMPATKRVGDEMAPIRLFGCLRGVKQKTKQACLVFSPFRFNLRFEIGREQLGGAPTL
jgi:hypothetical protein